MPCPEPVESRLHILISSFDLSPRHPKDVFSSGFRTRLQLPVRATSPTHLIWHDHVMKSQRRGISRGTESWNRNCGVPRWLRPTCREATHGGPPSSPLRVLGHPLTDVSTRRQYPEQYNALENQTLLNWRAVPFEHRCLSSLALVHSVTKPQNIF